MQGWDAKYRLQRQVVRGHLSYKGVLNVELEVLEQGVAGPLCAGDEFGPDGFQHKGVELQGVQHRVVVVPGGGVAGPQV